MKKILWMLVAFILLAQPAVFAQEDVLSGTVTAVLETYEALVGTVYLGVYAEDGTLKQVLSKPFQAEAGTYTCTFDTVQCFTTTAKNMLRQQQKIPLYIS